MRHGSLFSGIGGFDLAAEWVGWTNVFHCEWAEFQRKVLQYHFQDSISYDNIKTTDFTPHFRQIDVLTGGFPCQPFSVAGKRRGAGDDRYLWAEMLRAIREIQPTWIIAENVAGLVSMVQPGETIRVESQADLFGGAQTIIEDIRSKYILPDILGDLEREGYDVQALVIPACALGAPHRRDRLWIVAHRADSRVESVQQGREKCPDGSGSASDSDIDRSRCRRDKSQREEVREKRTKIQLSSHRSGEISTPTYPDDQRCHDRGNRGEERYVCQERNRNVEEDQSEWEGRQSWVGKDGSAHPCRGVSSDPESKRWASVSEDDGDSQKAQQGECRKEQSRRTDIPQDWWRNFPTQSPVCGRNDGISARLDGITISELRVKSIEAYGNAIVPQVAYEIFRIIEQL